MISPEFIRRYPFFAMLNDDQVRAIAMIAVEKVHPKGTLLVKENAPATKLIILVEGDVDLVYSGGGEGAISNALVGSIAPGEMLGVSSLIEPYTYISSARANGTVKVVEIDGVTLRAAMQADNQLGYILMCNVAAAVLERLKYTQVELAAARA